MQSERWRWPVGAMVVLGCALTTATAQSPAPAGEAAPPAAKATAEERAKAIELGAKHGPPPKVLKQVGDHWTPYDPPPAAEGSYLIKPGDNLWNLAGSNYGDPYLWPTIWNANRYITYSHWIYPGDPLTIPPLPTVVEETPPPPPPPPPPIRMEPQAPPPPPPSRPFSSLVPVAEEREMLCAPHLFDRWDPTPLRIVGREEAQRGFHAEGDVLYISAGRGMGLKPGTDYAVRRNDGPVRDPRRDKNDPTARVAQFIRTLGVVRILTVQEESATAVVRVSCDAMENGDVLVPFTAAASPMVAPRPLSAFAANDVGRMAGRVITVFDRKATIAATGHLVGIDIDSSTPLRAGDRVLFWKPAPNVGDRRVVHAQGIVLFVYGGGATVKVIESIAEIEPGQDVDVP